MFTKHGRNINAVARITRQFSSTTINCSIIQQKCARLEVERKFVVTPASAAYLRAGNKDLRFEKHEMLGNKTIHDVYYDRAGVLFGSGVYIRRRNGNWEAKKRTGGNFINSAFMELDGVDAVRGIIKHEFDVSVNEPEEHLKTCAEFVTDRESWMLDGRFRVDVDTMDFGHKVGEVELVSYLEDFADLDHAQREAAEKKVKVDMDEDIRAFMKSHPKAFPPGHPIGKLSAYFRMIAKD